MMPQMTKFGNSINSAKDLQLIDNFVKSLLNIFQLKQQNELRFDTTQKAGGFDELRF